WPMVIVRVVLILSSVLCGSAPSAGPVSRVSAASTTVIEQCRSFMDTVLFLLGSLAFDDLLPKPLVLVLGHRTRVVRLLQIEQLLPRGRRLDVALDFGAATAASGTNRPSIVTASSLEIAVDTRLTSFSPVCVGRATDILGTRVPAGK